MKKLFILLSFIAFCNFFAQAQTYSFCPGDTVTLGLPTYTGSLQWQESDDSLAWTDISGATYQPYITIFTISKYYRAKVTDGTCNPVYSQVRHATQGTCFTCGTSTVTDIDGNTYNTVSIGSQCWMRENLKVGTMINSTSGGQLQTNNGVIEKYCYNNNSANCDTYGGLYEWNEMMQYALSDTQMTGTTQGICPAGWHIPTHHEWTTLERAICTSGTCATDFPYDFTTTGWRGTDEGGKLKETGLTHWTSPNTGATNSSGFTSLPGGYRYYSDGTFYYSGNYGYWWSATEYSSTNAWIRILYYSYATVDRYNVTKESGFSVRCLKD